MIPNVTDRALGNLSLWTGVLASLKGSSSFPLPLELSYVVALVTV